MMQRSDSRPPISPALALRVAMLGGVALVLFAIVFFRLWYLQVLSGDQYLAQARDNRVRNERIPAPRGDIVDRNGKILVSNRQATAVQLEPNGLPPVERELAAKWARRVDARLRRPKGKRGPPVAIPATPDSLRKRFARLARVLQMSPKTIQREVIEQLALVPYSNVTVKTDAGQAVLNYLSERRLDFPGVTVQTVFLRRYPFKDFAAHLVGTVGEVSPQELKQVRFRGVTQGTIVGKGGIEWSYDRYLRGVDGKRRIQVDALGRPKGEVPEALRVSEPVPGRRLKLSLDYGLQKEGHAALAKVAGPGRAGGFVALDPTNGEVLALGSYPTFDPSVFAKPISQAKYEALASEENGAPLYDRAIAGLYPTGSTFKPITAMAALQRGLVTSDTPVNDGGCITVGAADQPFCNAGKVAHGTLSLRRALQVSSDVYFYTLGIYANPVKGQVIQQWARDLGLGRRTGIDLPGEFEGLVPDRRWRARIAERELDCRKRRKVPSCGISDARPWTVGDNVNLSVGQGDLQATPLQMAVAYAAIANGGKVVQPHLGLEVDDSAGRLIQRIEPGLARRVRFADAHQQAILEGLRLAASAPGGTSVDVFEGWKHDQFPVYGKTGTAERPGQADQSWYVAYSSNQGKRPIVIAVTVERGGFGAEAAAPAVRLMLSEWFNQSKKLVVGKSRDQ
jgi:penicillin-binding protein 2